MRKSYSGAAVSTTLTAAMLVADTSFAVVATTNWPNTTTGPFVVTVDRGLGTEEKVLCSAYTATSVTVASGGRGYDGTTAVGHSNGATANCTLDAVTIDEANAFVNQVGTVTPSTSAVGDAAADGTSTKAAAGDHKHGREPFASITTASAPGDTKNDGVSVSPARADHKHARESVASVTAGLTYGTAATASAPGDTEAPGTAATPARSDHVHGRELKTQTSLLASDGAVDSSSPTVGTPRYKIVGSVSQTTNSGGGVSHNFSTPFPNGLITVILTVGDTSPGSVMGITAIATQCTKTGIGAVVASGNAVCNVQPVRFNFEATGW